MRPIDADALDKRVYEEIPLKYFGSLKRMAFVRELIEEAPTLSPDEVRGVGEWITTRTWEHDGDPYCSKCGFEQSYMRFEKFKYCPSCGARLGNGGTDDS